MIANFARRKRDLEQNKTHVKNVLDKSNNGIKRLFYEPPIQKPLLLLPIVKVCYECGSRNIVEDYRYIVCEDCGVEKDTCFSKERDLICLEHIQASIRYPNTKILQFKEYVRVYQGNLCLRITPNLIDKVKQNLPESPSKKDVLKVLK